MPIFAQPGALINSGVTPSFCLSDPIQNNSFLVWDRDRQAFVNITASQAGQLVGSGTSSGSGSGGTVSISNVNVGNGSEVFVGELNGDQQFRSIVGQNGVIAQQGPQEIILENSIVVDQEVSSTDGFCIIIDHDNLNPQSKFSVKAPGQQVDLTLGSIDYTSNNLEIQVIADVLGVQPGQLLHSNLSWAALGFVAGQCLTIQGTGEQDGKYHIANITTTNNTDDTIVLDQPFIDPSDSGFQPPVTLTANWIEITGNQTITYTPGGFIAAGIQPGQSITISGAGDIDGVYTVSTTTDSSITFLESFVTTQTCISDTVTLSTPLEDLVVFCVDIDGNVESGSITANGSISTQGDLTVAGEFSTTGDITAGQEIYYQGQPLSDLIANSALTLPMGGIITVDNTGSVEAREIVAGIGITVANGSGSANPEISAQPATLQVDGIATGTVSIQPGGSSILTLTESDQGVIAGEYNRVQVNTSGRVIAGANTPITGNNGVIVNNTPGLAGNTEITLRNQQLTFTGSLFGSTVIPGLSDATIALSLASTGVTSGSYNRVIVNNEGRVTAATNQAISVGPGLIISNADGVSGNPLVELVQVPVTVSGDVTGASNFVPGQGIMIDLDLPDLITPGTYSQVTVDSKGRVVSAGGTGTGVIAGSYNRVDVDVNGNVVTGENQPIESTGGIIVTNPTGQTGNTSLTARDLQLTFAGDVLGQEVINDLSDTTIDLELSLTGVTANEYNRVTVDSKGRVVGGRNQPITVGNGLSITNADGFLGNPLIETQSWILDVTGDVTGSATMPGLQAGTINLTLPNVVSTGTYNSITVDSKGRVVAGQNIPLPTPYTLPPRLDQLENGLGFQGYVVWTGADYESRSLAGFANQITIQNPTGVNQTIIGLADNTRLPGRGGVYIPRGFDVERPATPEPGQFRFNLGTSLFEGYDGVDWQPLSYGEPGEYLPVAGGTMSGDIDMAGNNLVDPGTVDGRDVAQDGVVLDAINTGTGIKVQTGPNIFENRQVKTNTGSPVLITNGDGVAGDICIDLDFTQVGLMDPTEKLDQSETTILIQKPGSSIVERTTIKRAVERPAMRYFMSQW